MNSRPITASVSGLRHAVIAGVKPINIEKLMGHSTGISDSYYRATENELLEDYLNAVQVLTISNENRIQTQMDDQISSARKGKSYRHTKRKRFI
jgi:hypothetical protein